MKAVQTITIKIKTKTAAIRILALRLFCVFMTYTYFLPNSGFSNIFLYISMYLSGRKSVPSTDGLY